ncbi:MAG: hypothetical protein ACI9R3_000758 [Verrucomicrobiales bacterium]|jgi:hypothetical protein
MRGADRFSVFEPEGDDHRAAADFAVVVYAAGSFRFCGRRDGKHFETGRTGHVSEFTHEFRRMASRSEVESISRDRLLPDGAPLSPTAAVRDQ